MRTLYYVVILILIYSCSNSQEKILISNAFGDMIDITTLVEKGEFKLDSCERRLEKIIRISPKILTNNQEYKFQKSLADWVTEYNDWLDKKGLSKINITIDSLYIKSRYQYSYFYQNDIRDVYRLDTKESILQVDKISFFFQLDKKGMLVDDFQTNGWVIDKCDSVNSVVQNIYKTKVAFKDLIVDFNHIDSKNLTEDWEWLIGSDKKIIIISCIGDMFLSDSKDNIYWLDVGEGKFEVVADNMEDFKGKLKQSEFVDEWFLPDLVDELITTKGIPEQGKLYGYIKLPVIGGNFLPHNFEQTDIEVHFGISAQIHEQVKDLPVGAPVNIKIK